MIPHIENGEACIVVGLSTAGRKKAAKVTGSVSLGNKGIKGVEKDRESLQANLSQQKRAEPPKMNMATSIASGKQGLSDNRKASDAATIAKQATRQATRQASARTKLSTSAFNQQEAAKRSNKGKMSKADQSMSNTSRTQKAMSQLEQSLPRRQRFAASGGFKQVSKKLGGRDFKSLKNVTKGGVAETRGSKSTSASNQQEAAKRSNKGKMSKANRGMSNTSRTQKAMSQLEQSLPRRQRFAASGGFKRVGKKLGGRDFKSLKNVTKGGVAVI